jgi:hypothetical protein
LSRLKGHLAGAAVRRLSTSVHRQPSNDAITCIRHIAVLLDAGSEDYRTSEMAESWIGSAETYTFTPVHGSAKLDVALTIPPDWADEFETGWTKAIEALKQLAEK